MLATADTAFLKLLSTLGAPQKYQVFWLGDVLVIDAADCVAACTAALACRRLQEDLQFSGIRIYCEGWFYCQLNR
jgi:hypothetical protein